MNKFQAAFVGLLLSIGKDEWAEKVKALGSDSKVDISAEQLDEIKSEVESFKSRADKSESDLKASIEAKEKAEADLKAANEKLEASETKVTELTAKVEKLGKKPGADVVSPAAEADDTNAGSWMSEATASAAHNQAADNAFGQI
jgi:chromosome segregation ATPase